MCARFPRSAGADEGENERTTTTAYIVVVYQVVVVDDERGA